MCRGWMISYAAANKNSDEEKQFHFITYDIRITACAAGP